MPMVGIVCARVIAPATGAGDAGIEESGDAPQPRAGALHLHGVHARFFHEPDGVRHRFVVRHLKRAERHVRDDKGAGRPAPHRSRQQQHLVHRDRRRGVVAEYRHRGRVADEHDVNPGGIGEPCARGVVSRHDGNALPAPFQRADISRAKRSHRDIPCMVSMSRRLSRSSGTLSMSRVRPTRAAIASVGCPSKSATAT